MYDFRGELRSFIGSMLVAAFSGVSVSFAILSKRLSALIGNAISLSLLPPAVNCVSLSVVSRPLLSPSILLLLLVLNIQRISQ